MYECVRDILPIYLPYIFFAIGNSPDMYYNLLERYSAARTELESTTGIRARTRRDNHYTNTGIS